MPGAQTLVVDVLGDLYILPAMDDQGFRLRLSAGSSAAGSPEAGGSGVGGSGVAAAGGAGSGGICVVITRF